MHLSDTRHITIDGTEVTAAVTSAAEAKLAVKELRHKKKEYAHLKRALTRQRKTAQARAARASGKRKSKRGFLARTRAVLDFLTALPGAFGRASARMELPEIDGKLKQTDEILHNLDSVILQIEGKLLHLS